MVDVAQQLHPLPGLLWLVSYPKSGNTWLRFIVFHLVHGRLPATSRELDVFANSKRGWPTDVPRAIKSHECQAVAEPRLTDDATVIVVHRHPLDVLASAIDYAVLNRVVTDDATRTAYLRAFVEHDGDPEWHGAPNGCGAFSRHLADWRGDRHVALVLRYEDMLADPAATARAVAKAIGANVDDRAIATCAAETRFDRVRVVEEDEFARALAADGAPVGRFTSGRRVEAMRDGARFFSRGVAGRHVDTLSTEEARWAWDRFAGWAQPLGYRHDD